VGLLLLIDARVPSSILRCKESGLQFPSYTSSLNLLADATSSLEVSGRFIMLCYINDTNILL
jgi:hypothetical protein